MRPFVSVETTAATVVRYNRFIVAVAETSIIDYLMFLQIMAGFLHLDRLAIAAVVASFACP